MAQVKGGRLVALAAAGDKRSSFAPDVPTLAELGFKGVEADLWYGMLAPAGAPKDAVALLNAEIVKALKLPDVAERLTADGAVAVGGVVVCGGTPPPGVPPGGAVSVVKVLSGTRVVPLSLVATTRKW